ncbi:MAG: decaprenyl-phosphate phosphoribosyltransferase [Chloroflexi bacterium]|nr:decaprenyl-phosphate phosphoribosyltransferase [Chloroflexota bacterium]
MAERELSSADPVTQTGIVPALRGLLRTMRPHQWTKNVLVFAGIVFDGQLFNVDSLLRVLAAFALLCLASSTIYIVNDIVDVESDRKHPRKRRRPIASGQLPIPMAVTAAALIGAGTMLAAVALNWRVAVILVLYIVIHLLYSFWLKHVVILDILSVTSGFVLRVLTGVVVIQVQAFSPWLYAASGMLALFLVIGKRRQELLELADEAGSIRSTLSQYNLPLLDEMLRMVVTGTLLTYLFYTVESPSVLLAGTKLGLVTVPFVLYALFRYMYLIHVRGEGSAPDEVLLRDRPLQISILLWGITFIVVLYVLPGA